MDSCAESGYPFAIPDLWQITNLATIQDEKVASSTGCWVLAQHGPDLGLDAEGKNENLSGFFEAISFSIPDLDELEFRPLEKLEPQEDSSPPELTDDSVDEREIVSDIAQPPIEEDIWLCPDLTAQVKPHRKFKSWEIFNNSGFKEPQPEFISERGAIAFDAALIAHEATGDRAPAKRVKIIKSDPFLTGLSLLRLGRESIFFHYIEKEEKFQPRLENGRISGYTIDSLGSLTTDFVHHGNQMRLMEKFIDSVFTSIDSAQPFISLASAFSTILSAMQWKAGDEPNSAGGLLHLQSLLRGPRLVLSYIGEMKEAIGVIQSNHELISKIFQFLQDNEHKDWGLCQIGSQILARASEPWLRSLSHWLGISNGRPNQPPNEPPDEPPVKPLRRPPNGLAVEIPIQNSHKPSKKASPDSHSVRHDFETSSIPSFISEEDTKVISSVVQGLQMIRSHSPEHPLSRPDRFGLDSSCIPTWYFSWQDVDRIVLQAKEYEQRLSKTIKRFHSSDIPRSDAVMDSLSCLSRKPDASDWSGKDLHIEIGTSITEIEKSLSGSLPGNLGNNSLAQAVIDYIDLGHEKAGAESAIFTPPISLVPLLSFNPIIYAQSRLVNHACLRLLFKDHKLRFHFSILHSFSLLGDGVFAARLSHALFDPELKSAQRRKGHSRSGVFGLRLGHRESWPPEVSELRLVLMGIPVVNFRPDSHGKRPSSADGGLPGHLNFFLREDELKRSVDPHSVEALDFLRLQYKPPAPLETVLTPLCLEKYHLIFKLLLRSIRILYAVNQLPRTPCHRFIHRQRLKIIYQRFRFEAHHLVMAISGYFFDGIRSNWNIFLQKLDAIESYLDEFDCGDKHGLEKLRRFHETVLDRIMFALLLRTRQAQVMKLLEEIFSCVLLFAKISKSDDPAQEIEDLYTGFQTNVRSFVALCRASSDQRGPGTNGQEEFEKDNYGENRGNNMAQLVLRLEMSGYYRCAMLE